MSATKNNFLWKCFPVKFQTNWWNRMKSSVTSECYLLLAQSCYTGTTLRFSIACSLSINCVCVLKAQSNWMTLDVQKRYCKLGLTFVFQLWSRCLSRANFANDFLELNNDPCFVSKCVASSMKQKQNPNPHPIPPPKSPFVGDPAGLKVWYHVKSMIITYDTLAACTSPPALALLYSLPAPRGTSACAVGSSFLSRKSRCSHSTQTRESACRGSCLHTAHVSNCNISKKVSFTVRSYFLSLALFSRFGM